MLIPSRRECPLQLPLVCQSQRGSVAEEYRTRQIRRPDRHALLEFGKNVIAHLTGYPCGPFQPGLTIPARAGGDPTERNPLADVRLILPMDSLPRQKMHRFGKGPFGLKALVNHEPDHRRNSIDSPVRLQLQSLAQLIDSVDRRGRSQNLLEQNEILVVGGGHD